jgi:cation transport ATPase
MEEDTRRVTFILSDVTGSCDGCYNKKINKFKEFANGVEALFDKTQETITITVTYGNADTFEKKLIQEKKTADWTYERIASSHQTIEKLKSAKIATKPSINPQTWLPWLKPGLALCIGYFELCCVLMAWVAPHMWLWVAGINLILITLLGSEYFIAAKASMRYLAPMMLGLLIMLCLPVMVPIVALQYMHTWMVGVSCMLVATIGLLWSIRDTLNMETLIVLAITMAWLFSTMQLCFPVLASAFGLQLYFQDSMIILGVVGLAKQLKADWQKDKTNYLVYDAKAHAWVEKTYAQVLTGDVIKLTNQVYPFRLKLHEEESAINVNQGPRIGQEHAKREVGPGGYIQPWEVIKNGQDRIATVSEAPVAKRKMLKGWADQVAQYFIPIMISLAALSGLLWFCFGPATQAIPLAIKSFMGVLMATCPCVLGVVAPICENITRQKLSEAGCHLNRENSIGHWQSIKQVVFDKTGTLTEIAQDDQKNWPYREGCDREFIQDLKRQGKLSFILSGDNDSERRKDLNNQFGMTDEHILCHPVFHQSPEHKHALLQWLAYTEATEFPESLVALERAYHQLNKDTDCEEIKDNTEAMIQALDALKAETKPKTTYSLLYVDDGPGLVNQARHYMTLQVAQKTDKTTGVADGIIHSPKILADVFPVMEAGLKYLNQQLTVAGLYNLIAIPLMAGACWFWFMPSPWMGALLMNAFSLYLIHRAQGITHALPIANVSNGRGDFRHAEALNNEHEQIKGQDSEKPFGPGFGNKRVFS